METLTAIRKSGDFTVPCYGVLTDYTCIPFLAETDLDGYFIAHEDLRAELVEKGIPSDRIMSPASRWTKSSRITWKRPQRATILPYRKIRMCSSL